MGKLDELRRQTAGNIDDSMGVGRVSRPLETAAASPARWQGVTKSKSAAEIPTDKIGPDSDQPRTEFDEDTLQQLAESLKARGQLQPIRVRWDEGRGAYVIICGERRWRAAQMAGLPMMSCVVVDGVLDPAELLSIQLIENALREDLKPIEQAKAFRALMDRNGWSARQVARELAYPQSSLVKILTLLELPAAVKDHVERGSLSPATAYEIGKLDSPEAQADVAARAVAEGLNRAEVVAAVRERATKSARTSKGNGAKPKPRRTSATIRTTAGKVTVENRKGVDDATIRAAMIEVMAQLDGRAEGRGEAA
jgi:ParB family chromosome partitioning protein